jgi:hypothetical protein
MWGCFTAELLGQVVPSGTLRSGYLNLIEMENDTAYDNICSSKCRSRCSISLIKVQLALTVCIES